MLGKRRSDFERDPHVGRMERMYGRRCDADHNHRNTAEVDGLPDDLARSSELALPETVGENRGNRADRGVIRRREAPARHRAPSEDFPREALPHHVMSDDVRKEPRLSAPVHPLEARRERQVLSLDVLECDQPLRFGIGERPDQNLVEHGKHRGVHADPHRHGQDNSQGESWIPAQIAKGESNFWNHDFVPSVQNVGETQHLKTGVLHQRCDSDSGQAVFAVFL